MKDLSERIDDLETRIAYQDKVIGDLNDVIMAQWRKMEAIEAHLRRLGEEMQMVEASDVPANQKPPHY